VWYQKLKNGNEVFTEIGKLDPTEQRLGKLWIQRENQEKELIAKELHRPVHTLSQDLNNDGSIEHIISEFGHLTGSISKINSDATSQLLWPNPGAIQTQMHDVNNDGMMDLVSLVAQGDEAIVSFIQQKNGDFKPEYLMRYQPNYGSSWFEMMDFDGDGDLDLITANGDNADLTYTQKPYHGMRISLNDGYGNFKEAFFYQLNGATRLVAEDFDQDNDIDIALVSTFPDYENHPEMAFIYLENLGGFNFKENIIEDVNFGRWFLLDKGDIDKDGDIDILISSFTYTFSPVPNEFQKTWEENDVDLILLKNNLFK
jgi:predicted nucleotidyltransferase